MQLQDWLRRKVQHRPRLYAALRSVKRAARSLVAGPPPPAEAWRARIEAQEPLPAFSVGTPAAITVRVTNTSSLPWPGGGHVALSYHWHRGEGGVWAFDGGRTPLPDGLAPGESATVQCVVKPPNTPSAYDLELDLVWGDEAWFGQRGSAAPRHRVTVAAVQPESLPEIDYEQAYAAADLTRDYWAVVGPASAEEFRLLGRSKVEMLKNLGLDARSRVLDVGCGTGSLAEALLDVLGDEGVYHGTDLSEKAVEFCRQRYPRPNFHFTRNEMTAVPVQGQFDFVVFFSVFTHTYLPETRLLLAEAARLAGEGGQILADVFESDLPGESIGTRAMMVLARGRLLGLADEMGLEAHTVSAFDWDPTGPRRIQRVLRRFARRG
jgi:SAM-dependent methyltransferase